MKTKSLSIFLVALFVVEMNLGAVEDNNENKEDEKFKYEKIDKEVPVNEVDLFLKTILIGNSMVGKSALSKKICKNEFPEKYSPTVGFDFFNLKFRIVSDKKPVLKYQIWDCCGQEVCKSLISSFYGNASVFLLAYDVTNEESFNDIESWVKDVKAKNTVETIHFVLIGTKIDLENKRVVSKESGRKFAEEKGMKFVEVSASTGDGIKELEYILAKIIYEEFNRKRKVEDDSECDFIVGEKPTHSRSLCDCCKEICEDC